MQIIGANLLMCFGQCKRESYFYVHMMPHCRWGLCTSDIRISSKGVIFLPFLSYAVFFWDEQRDSTILKHKLKSCAACCKAQLWLDCCGVQEFCYLSQVNKNCYVCNLHFVDGKPAAQNPDPFKSGCFAKVSSFGVPLVTG